MARAARPLTSVIAAFVLLLLNTLPALAGTGLPVPPVYTPSDMVLTVVTDQPNMVVEMPINGSVSSVSINWGDGNSTDNIYQPGNQSHTYLNAGTFTVVISGLMTRFGSDGGYIGASKVTGVQQWGTLGLTSLRCAFSGATSLTSLPAALPSGVTDLSYMLAGTSIFNQDISGWNTSTVTNMYGMFSGATAFNNGATSNDGSHPLQTVGSAWDVSTVTDMSYMFINASSFNQSISNWNTSAVTSLLAMFWGASDFNKPIGAWDVSAVTDFSHMFWGASSFNQDVAAWDTGAATTVANMFRGASAFNNGDAGNNQSHPMDASGTNWDLSSVTTSWGMFLGSTAFNQSVDNWNFAVNVSTAEMFYEARSFNQDVSSWNTPSLISAPHMFRGAWAFNNGGQPFTSATGAWSTSTVQDMSVMFADATAFNRDISSWDTHSVGSMPCMFCGATSFNNGGQPLLTNGNKWNVSNVVDMSSMFTNANAFNQDISNWDVGSVTNMDTMFYSALSFNQPIGSWDVSSVTRMWSMFNAAKAFNQSLNSWDTSKVTEMGNMFEWAEAFNGNITSWNTSAVTNFYAMFANAKAFNQDISSWNVGNVTNMTHMFNGAVAFNQPIGTWNTSKVTSMGAMFLGTTFDQDIGGWDTSSLNDAWDMFAAGSLSTANYDKLLIGWSDNANRNGVGLLVANTTMYSSAAAAARAKMVGTGAGEFHWNISDGGLLTASVTTPPTAGSLVYGQPLSAAALLGGVANVPGTFAFTSPTTVPDVGTSSQQVTFTPTDNSLSPVTLEVSVTVTQAPQTLEWGTAFAAQTSGVYMSQFTALATSSVGLTVSYSGSGGCAVLGDLVTLVSPTQSCVVTASQAGNTNYAAATSIEHTITTAKAPMPTILIGVGSSSMTYNPTTPALQWIQISGGSGIGVRTWTVPTGDPCFVTDSAGVLTVTASGGGTCHITANQSGDDYYLPGSSNQVTITIDKATPTASFSPTTASATVGQPFTEPTLTTDSTGSVSYSSSDTTVATVDATGQVTPVGVGTATITASIQTNNDFTAVQAAYSVSVAASSQVLTWDAATAAITSQAYGSTFSVSATSSAGLTPTYSAAGGCSILNGVVTMTSGTTACFITANQPGDATHPAAGQITQTITATLATQAPLLASPVLSQLTYAAQPLATTTLAVSGGSGIGALSFAVTAGDPCTATLVGAVPTVTASGAGTCRITVTKASDGNYDVMSASLVTITINPAAATVTLSTTPQTVVFGAAFTAPTATTNSTAAIAYSSSNTAVATVNATTGAVTIIGVGTATISASAPAASNYLAAPAVSYQLTVTAATQTLAWDAATSALATQVFGATFTVGATSTAGLIPTYAAAGGCTIAGQTVTVTSGTTACVLTASQAGGGNFTAAAPITLTIATTPATQAALILNATATAITYNPAPAATSTLSLTGGSGVGVVTYAVTAGDPCTIAVTGATATVSATGAGQCRVTATKPADGNYLVTTSNTVTISIAQATAVVTMNTAAQSVTFGAAFVSPTATTNSTAPITYASSNPAVATVNATTGAVSIIGVGVTTISASTAANVDFTASAPVTYQLTVLAGTQVLTWDAATSGLTTQAFGSSFTVGGTSSAGLPISYAVSGGCTLAGTTVTMTSGTTACVITADQSGSATVAAATQITKTVAASLAVQSPLLLSASSTALTFNPVVAPNTALQVSGGSGTGAVSFSVTAGDPCTVSTVGGVTTLSASSAGTCRVTATQAADANYQSMSSSQLVVTIAKATPTLTFDTTARNVQFGQTFVGALATSTSSAAVVYSSSNPAVATVNSATGAVTIVGVGSTSISATTPADTNFVASAPISYALTVTAVPQTLAWDSPTSTLTSKSFGDVFPVAAVSSAGLTATYSVSGGCTLAGGQVTMTSGTTSCVITASQSGTATVTAASSISKTVTAAKIAQTPVAVSVSGSSLVFDPVVAPAATLNATGGSGSNTVSFQLRTGDPCTMSVSGTTATVTATGAGVCRVTTTRAGDSNYLNANTVTTDITVAKAVAVFTLGTPPKSVVFGSSVTPPNVDLNSVGTIRYSSSNPAVVDVDPSTGALTIQGVGTATITIQATASANFTAPAPVSYDVTIDPVAPAAPLNVRTALNGTTLEVAWDAPSFTGGTPIQRYVVSAAAAATQFGCTAIAPATSCVIEGLNPGADYTVAVEAVAAGLSSPLSSRSAPVVASVPANAVDPTPEPSAAPTDAPTDGAGDTAPAVVDDRGLEVVNIAQDDPVAVAQATVKTVALVTAAAAATAAVAAAGAAASAAAGAATTGLGGSSPSSSGGTSGTVRPRESTSSGPASKADRSDDANEMRDITERMTEIDGLTVAHEKWGDRLAMWGLTALTFTDAPTHRTAVRVANKSPLVAKMILDGAYLRAMIGATALVLPIVSVILGLSGVAFNSGVFLPPTVGVLLGLILIGVFDVMAATFGIVVFCVGMALTAGVSTSADIRVFFGLLAAVITPSLLATSFRSVRRPAATTFDDWWQRLIDVTVAPVLAAAMVTTTIGFLPALGGVDFPIARSGMRMAFIVALAMVVRVVLEELAAQLFPARLDRVHPDELASPHRTQQIIALVMRAAVFYFVSQAIVGTGWYLVVGTILFMLPPVLSLFTHRLPNSTKLHQILPTGLPAFTFSLVLGVIGLTILLRVVGPTVNLAQIGFAILPVPSTTFSVVRLFGREPAEGAVRLSERESMAWVVRIGGVLLVLLTARLLGLF